MTTPTSGGPATFGEFLRFLRRRMQMTQQELGIALGYSTAMVARLESGERLPDVGLVKTAYVEALGLKHEPELAARLVELAQRARGEVAPPPVSHPTSRKVNPYRAVSLPVQLTRFIGREREVQTATRLLDRSRLLTLTGSGGAGKTRLAQQVAATSLVNYPDGVWYAELATLSDPDLLVDAVMPALGLNVNGRPTMEHLTAFIRDRHALLVLDNCEHLIDGVATLVLGVLRACPHVSILTTSREALNVEGEIAWRVPPMQPAEAAELFVERAHAAQPNLALDVADATIAHICQRLDGIPLALELAAVRLQGMGLADLATRLDDRFNLLTGGLRGALPRQQTLRATIDWSYALLSEAERILFRRLSIFVGGWTAELAEQVCADLPPLLRREGAGEPGPSDVLPLLLSLVSKSLVLMDAEQHDGETRYRYLETIHEYALQKLAEHCEQEALQRRHAEVFAALAERSAQPIRGPQQRWWLARLERDYPNLHAALTWSFGPQGDALVGCRLFSQLGIFWIFATHGADRQRWSHLARGAVTEQMPPQICGGVWMYGTWIDPLLTTEEALVGLQRALAYYAAAGDQGRMAEAKAFIGLTMSKRDARDSDIRRVLEEGVALARAAGDTMMQVWTQIALGWHVQKLHEFDRAEALFKEALRLSRRRGIPASAALASGYLARLYMERLRFREALPYAQESADVARQINYNDRVLLAECYIAEITRFLGDVPRAIALNEACLAFAREKCEPHDQWRPYYQLSKALSDAGEHDRAQALLDEWIKTPFQRMVLRADGNTNWYDGYILDALARVASGRGDAARAARLFGVADTAFAVSGEDRGLHNAWDNAPSIAKARSALGDMAYEAAYAEGRTMTPEQAVAYALQGSQAEAEAHEPPVR